MDFDFTNEIIVPDTTGYISFGGTAGIELAIGSTGQRVNTAGILRYNSSTLRNEQYFGTTWGNIGTGDGTVTSVGFIDASTTPIYTVNNSPVTTSGTLTITLNAQEKNTLFVGPTSGANAQPTFRTISLVQNDLSDVSITTPTTNQALVYNGTSWVNTALTSTSYSTTVGPGGVIAWSLVSGTKYNATITHNLGTKSVVIMCYNVATNAVVLPDQITITNTSSVVIQVVGNTVEINVTIIANGSVISGSYGGVTSIIGTANQITASNPTGVVTLSLPTTINVTNVVVAGQYLYSVSTGIVAAGTTAATATPLTSTFSAITSGTGGVSLPVPIQGGFQATIANRSGSTIIVYPNSGGTIEAFGINVGISIPNNTTVVFGSASTTAWGLISNLYNAGTGVTVASTSGGQFTVSIPQSVATTATPTFAGMTLSGKQSFNFSGDELQLSIDTSPFRTGSWSVTASGQLYTLLGDYAMNYWTHNTAIDSSGNFVGRDDSGPCTLWTYTENGFIKTYSAVTALAGTAPVWNLVNIFDTNTGQASVYGQQTFTFSGDEKQISLDASKLREGSWSINQYGSIVALVNDYVMNYQVHNTALNPTTGNFSISDDPGTQTAFNVFSESGWLSTFNSLATGSLAVPKFVAVDKFDTNNGNRYSTGVLQGQTGFTAISTGALPSSGNWTNLTSCGAWGAFGSMYIATQQSGNTAAISTDGLTWTSTTLPVSASWSSIAWNGSVFVIVASGSTSVAVATLNSIQSVISSWTTGTMPSAAAWTDVTYGNGVFVAIASGGTATAYSSNGTTWTAGGALPASATWNAIRWNGSVFVAIASGSTNTAYSINGTTWITGGALPASTTWVDIAWNGYQFCAIASGGTAAATSMDGVTWTAQTLPATAAWSSIAWNGFQFCIVSGGPSTGTAGASTVAATSPTGLTGSWTLRTLPVSAQWSMVRSNFGIGAQFIAVATNTSTAAVNISLSSSPLIITAPTGTNNTQAASTAFVASTVTVNRTLTYVATSLDSPNNADWTINALAATVADPTNSAINVRQFSNTIEQGVGATVPIPANATNISVTYQGRPQTAPGSASTLVLNLYARILANPTTPAAVGAWSTAHAFTSAAVPTNAFISTYTYTATLASLSLTAGNTYQFEITRAASGVASNWLMSLLSISFT